MSAALIVATLLTLSPRFCINGGKSGTPEVERLRAQLASGDRGARMTALQELTSLVSGSELQALLLQAAKDEDCAIRVTAAESLHRVGSHLDVTVETLRAALSDRDCAARQQAAQAALQLGRTAAPLTDALLVVTADPDWRLRVTAITTLGWIGEAARKAAPRIGEMARTDPDDEVRYAAKWAGFLIEPETSMQALDDLLRDPNEGVRLMAAETVTRLGPAAGALVPALSAAIKDTRGDRTCTGGASCGYAVTKARAQAATALGALGRVALTARPSLRAIANDKHEETAVRQAARNAVAALDRSQ